MIQRVADGLRISELKKVTPAATTEAQMTMFDLSANANPDSVSYSNLVVVDLPPINNSKYSFGATSKIDFFGLDGSWDAVTDSQTIASMANNYTVPGIGADAEGFPGIALYDYQLRIYDIPTETYKKFWAVTIEYAGTNVPQMDAALFVIGIIKPNTALSNDLQMECYSAGYTSEFGLPSKYTGAVLIEDLKPYPVVAAANITSTLDCILVVKGPGNNVNETLYCPCFQFSHTYDSGTGYGYINARCGSLQTTHKKGTTTVMQDMIIASDQEDAMVNAAAITDTYRLGTEIDLSPITDQIDDINEELVSLSDDIDTISDSIDSINETIEDIPGQIEEAVITATKEIMSEQASQFVAR